MVLFDNPLTGQSYALWSGIMNDVPVFVLGYFFAFIPWYLHNRCHVDGCYKLGKYPYHHYKLCKRHHPEVPEDISHAHVMSLRRNK